MIYANDTANDWNQTGQQNYTVKVPCGYYVNSNLNLDNDITGCTGTILYINASYVTLDCQNHYLQTTGNYSINVTSKNNVTIKNCRINGSSSNSHDGIRYYQASNGTISNNTVTEANYGISLLYSSNNNISNNNVAAGYTIYIDSSSNNSIAGGSIKLPSTGGGKEGKVYNLFNVSSTNSFRNTNFTVARQIYLNNTNDWFNYNNDTTGGIWINTSLNVAQSTISRELININQNLVQWNDTNISKTGITATYNVSGLLANTYYYIFNNSVLAYILQTDSNGVLPSFTIYLGSEHEIKVKYQTAPVFGYTLLQEGADSYAGTDDTFVRCMPDPELVCSGADADTNYENSTDEIYITGSAMAPYAMYQGLVRFNVSSLSDQSKINLANLSMHLFYSSGSASSTYAYAILEDWNVSNVTWNTKPDYNNTYTASTSVSSVDNWYGLNIAYDVQNWIDGAQNNGTYLTTGVFGMTSAGRKFRDDRNGTYSPKLAVNFTIKNQTWGSITNNTNINLTKFFFDEDGDDLNYTYQITGSNITVSINNDTGQVTLVPQTGWYGTEYVVFTATDGINTTSSNNVTLEVKPCSVAMGFSTELLNGIQFGTVDPTNQINNATENNGSGATDYSIQVQINYCDPSTTKLWTSVNQSFNTTGGDSIPYTLYFYRYNNTNNTVPGSSQTPYSLDYQLIGDNLQNGKYSYMKFFINVSTGTVPGNYKSYTFFKLNLTS